MAGFGVRHLPRMKIQMTVAATIMVTFVASLASTTEYSRTRTVVFLLIAAAAAGYVENLTLSSMALVSLPVSWVLSVPLSAPWQSRYTHPS